MANEPFLATIGENLFDLGLIARHFATDDMERAMERSVEVARRTSEARLRFFEGFFEEWCQKLFAVTWTPSGFGAHATNLERTLKKPTIAGQGFDVRDWNSGV